MKKIIPLFLILCVAAAFFAGCATIGKAKDEMPINGVIQFHDITAVIPSDYTRDSTQSDEDLWIFEKGMYKKYVIFKRSDITSNAETQLNDYVEYITAQGGSASCGTYLYVQASLGTYYLQDVYCQEILFVYNNSIYTFALRGGTEEEFQSFLNHINTPDTIQSEASK